MGQLADGGGLAGAVDADHEDDARRGGARTLRGARGVCRRRQGGSVAAEDAEELVLQFGLELRAIGERPAFDFIAHGLQDFAGGAHAEVGSEQCDFELRQQRRVDLPVAGQQILDARGQLRARLAHRLLEPLQQRGLGFSEQGDHRASCSGAPNTQF